MARGVFGLHRQEGAGSHVQRDSLEDYSAFPEPLQQAVCEMQAGRGRRYRAFLTGKRGLIVGPIPFIGGAPRRNIRRQRHAGDRISIGE